MAYTDVDYFYPAIYHVGVIIRDAGLATHDADELNSYDGWLITLDTIAKEEQHKNVAVFDAANIPSFSQKESNWPRSDVTIHLEIRSSGFLEAYTRAQKICRAIDESYRSIFTVWDDQLTFYSSWQVKYEYGGLYRQSGPQGIERDDKYRPRFRIEYMCNRVIRETV